MKKILFNKTKLYLIKKLQQQKTINNKIKIKKTMKNNKILLNIEKKLLIQKILNVRK